MEEFVEEDSEGPDIYPVVVGVLEQHFGGHILIGSAEGVSLEGDVLGGPAKVAYFDVGTGVEE